MSVFKSLLAGCETPYKRENKVCVEGELLPHQALIRSVFLTFTVCAQMFP